jgi:3-hydroxymyristoyl/3-hydroxydecanoyl-(acyl carrier protein) dehydratase
LEESVGVVDVLIPFEHPSLEGHFPEHAIVPGAVTLSFVERALGDWLGGDFHVCLAPTVKFLHPVFPGDALKVTFRNTGAGRVEFKVAGDKGLVAEGRFGYSAEG